MKKGIQLIFGKPFKKENNFLSKYFRFAYWAMIIFYFLTTTVLGLSAYYYPKGITSFITWAVGLPLIFRSTYNMVGKLNKMEREA